jgi:hypothetical protein
MFYIALSVHYCCNSTHLGTPSIFEISAGFVRKKGGRKIPSMFHLCLIKDGTVFPLTNPAQNEIATY